MKIRIFDTELNAEDIKAVRQACIGSFIQISTALRDPSNDPNGVLRFQRKHYFNLIDYFDGESSALERTASFESQILKNLRELNEPEIYIDDQLVTHQYAIVLRMALTNEYYVDKRSAKRLINSLVQGLK